MDFPLNKKDVNSLPLVHTELPKLNMKEKKHSGLPSHILTSSLAKQYLSDKEERKRKKKKTDSSVDDTEMDVPETSESIDDKLAF